MYTNGVKPPSSSLTKYFTHGFREILTTFTHTEMQKLLDISPVLFKKWYYSAFFEDTVLSPANILNSYFRKNKNEVASIYYCVNPSDRGDKKFIYQLQKDSVQCHSFIKNLKALTDYCFPVAAFHKSDLYPYTIPDDLSKNLITSDGYYFEFLVGMAQRFNLITPMPSINTCKYQKNGLQCHHFFSQSNTQILTSLMDAALEIFIEKFTNTLQMPHNILTPSIMKRILIESVTTDDIFKKVYTSLGFDFDEMLRMVEISVLSDENEMLMSSAYFLGALLDKYFFSPMGNYFKLITPLYSVPFDFINETDYVRPVLLTGCDVSGDIFSPCNYFSLTPIGEEILGCENANPLFQDISQDFTEYQIQLFLSSTIHVNQMNIADYFMQHNTLEIYTIKVRYADNPLFWKVIQVPSDYPVTRLYNLITTYFGFEKNNHYTFSVRSTCSTTMSNSPIDKASSFQLKDLLPNNHLLLSDGLNNFPDLEVLLKKTGKNQKNCNYPRLLRQSRAITFEEQHCNQ